MPNHLWTRIPSVLLTPSPAISSFAVHTRPYSTRKTLTHLNSSGAAHMVPLPSPDPTAENHKLATQRTAIAVSFVRFSNSAAAPLIRSVSLKKGDVLAIARVAGIMAAKRTSDLVPLCHNIGIGGVEVDVQVVGGSLGEGDESLKGRRAKSAERDGKVESLVEGVASPIETLDSEDLPVDDCGEFGGVRLLARVQTYGQTGVEMEALTAVSVASLTVYDMCKAVDKGMRIGGTRVVLKEGGRSGSWREGHI